MNKDKKHAWIVTTQEPDGFIWSDVATTRASARIWAKDKRLLGKRAGIRMVALPRVVSGWTT